MDLLTVWEVIPTYSAAYPSQGNGLVERVHRTIKRSAERSGRSVHQIVAFYNNTVHSATGAVPFELLFASKSKVVGGQQQRNTLKT